jgi:putative SOS response-associated peptidase YedK
VCNLYRIKTSVQEIAGLFGASADPDLVWKGEIYPRYQAPVVRAADGGRVVELMVWGFPRQVPGKTKMLTKHVTNARNLDSPFWRSSVMAPARRCLVPFTQFAEPKPGKDAEGRPGQHWFNVRERPIAAFAGLWRPSPEGAFFAFATTEPNELIRPLHEKAMPLILHDEDQERWLTGGHQVALALQMPFPSQLMGIEC